MFKQEKIDRRAYQRALLEFRQRHFLEEMEKNLEVATSIRDNSEAKDKDRIDAIGKIARMLGGLQPEKESKQESSHPDNLSGDEKGFILSENEEERIKKFINGA